MRGGRGRLVLAEDEAMGDSEGSFGSVGSLWKKDREGAFREEDSREGEGSKGTTLAVVDAVPGMGSYLVVTDSGMMQGEDGAVLLPRCCRRRSLGQLGPRA